MDINEEGTVAAAATAITTPRCSMPPPPREFHLNRPFLGLLVHDDTKTVLFMAHVNDPRSRNV